MMGDELLSFRHFMLEDMIPFIINIFGRIIPVFQHRRSGYIRPVVMAMAGVMLDALVGLKKKAVIFFKHESSTVFLLHWE